MRLRGRRSPAVTVGSAVALLAAIAVAATASVGRGQAVPSSRSGLARLQPSSDAGHGNPVEADWSTLTSRHSHVVAAPPGPHLLEAATGRNREGRRRAVFILYEADPLTAEWRPVLSVDGYVEDDGITTAEFELPVDLGPGLGRGTRVVGYVGAIPGTRPQYRSRQGGWKPLTFLSAGDAGAGFAEMPPDAELPLSLNDAV